MWCEEENGPEPPPGPLGGSMSLRAEEIKESDCAGGEGRAPSARLESKETDRKRFAIRLNVHAVNRVQPRSRTRGK